MTPDERLARVTTFFETLSADDVAGLTALYAPDACFKDPFNEVHGVAAIERIFRHMFVQVDAPRFVVTEAFAVGDQAFLAWEFHFRMKRFSALPQCIRGASHLRFSPDGKVAAHRDYWDAAEELYEKLPVLGRLMRWLKRQARA
ncbi:MAG: nuclear transport factor 2 family protein [Burkholderiaceae bacterium]